MNTKYALLKNRVQHTGRYRFLPISLCFLFLLTGNWAAHAQGPDILVKATSLSATSNSQPRGMAADADGNAYMAGVFSGSVSFGNDPGSTTLVSAGGTDIFIVKYNKSGVFQWAKRAGGTDNDNGYGIAVSGTSVYVTGNFNLTADFNTPSATGSNELTSTGGADGFIAKFSDSGVLQWTKRYGGTGNDLGSGLAVSGASVYMVGSFSLTANFNTPAATGSNELTSAGGTDFYIAKYDDTGAFQWAKRAGGTGTESGVGIVAAGSSIYATGSFNLTADFNTPSATGSNELTSAGAADGFIVKYNDTGALQWVKRLGGTGSDAGIGIGISGTSVYVTGSFNNTANFNTPSASGSNELISAGGLDIYIAKFDDTGAFQWAKRSGGTGTDSAIRMAVSGTSVYIGGIFETTANFNTPSAAGSNELVSAGGQDAYLAKYDDNGTFQWAKRAGGSGNDYCYGVATFGTSVFLTGHFRGTANFNNPSASGSNELTTISSTYDLYLARYGCIPPSVSIAATPSNTITSGGSVTLTASGADSYTWSSGESTTAITVSNVTSATAFSVTGVTGACSGTATAQVSVTQAANQTNPCFSDGSTWTARPEAEDNMWSSVTYGMADGNPLFVAVAQSGTNRVMTSPDGITWTARNAAEANQWLSVTYGMAGGNPLFVAVAQSGTNRVMTSPDGITWTARNAAAANQWLSVTYGMAGGNPLFVAVAQSGTNRVMTSPDGITWTARNAAAANQWQSVTYGMAGGNPLFVAVAQSGTNRVMTSPDGITWTARTAAAANQWRSVTYGNGQFVAVAASGTNRVMTSPDGITWTARTAAEANSWQSVTYGMAGGNPLFVAVAGDGTDWVMTSPDGITWTARPAAAANSWQSVTYGMAGGNPLFVAVASDGTNQVMTSSGGPSVSISPASQTITAGGSVTLTASGADSYTWSTGESTTAITVSNVTSATAFSVTGVTGACSATATAQVSVTAVAIPISIQLSASAPAVCPGGSTNLLVTASGGTSPYAYTWVAPQGATIIGPTNTSAVLANPATSGLKTFTVTVAGSDGSSVTSMLTIQVSDLPAPTLTAAGVCSATSVLSLTGVDNAFSLQWYQGNTLISSQSASYPASGQIIGGGNGAGNALNQLSYPDYITTDAQGNVYVSNGNRVTRFAPGSTSATNGVVVAGDNGAGDAPNQLESPNGVILDASGNLYVADYRNNRVQKFPTGSNQATNGITVAGGNGAGSGLNQINRPIGVGIDQAGYLYVSDQFNYRVTKFPPNSTSATSGTIVAGGNGSGSDLNQIQANGIWVTPAGDVYVADYGNSRILKFPAGSTQSTNGIIVAGGNGSGNALNQPDGPADVYVDAAGNIYVADENETRVLFFPAGSSQSTNGIVVAGVGGTGSGLNQLDDFQGLTVDAKGTLYVADGSNNRVMKYVPTVPTSYTTSAVGAYSVKAINALGCSVSSNTITLGTPPSVSISPASQTITSGGSVTLTASGADSYTWSTGESTTAITVSNVTSATAFSVTGVTGGCSATATAQVSVTQAANQTNPCFSDGSTWTARPAAEANSWLSVTYGMAGGNPLFVAVASNGTNRVMTSPDGSTWTARPAAAANSWRSVTYGMAGGNPLFVAVASDGTNRVMTSPDGITWTARPAAAANLWQSVTYGMAGGNPLFVAVAGSGTNRVMTSPDGITWTARTAAAANSWQSVTYGMAGGNPLFVAVASDGTNRVMTSPDGITWTARTAAAAIPWLSVTYGMAGGNPLFVAVAGGGTNRVMTSPDGITWTARTAAEANLWQSVTYGMAGGNPLFVAVAGGGTNRVMTSPDGITWTARTAAEATTWNSVTYGNGQFVAVAGDGTNRVMTSSGGPSVSISPASQTITAGGSVTLTASGADSYTWSTGESTTAITVSNVTSATAFSVTGVTGGCSATASAAVSVTACSLTVTATPSSQTITAGGSVTLTASGATSYSWSTGESTTAITVSNVTSATAFSVTGVTGACSATATAQVSVTQPTPLALTASAGLACVGGSSALSVSTTGGLQPYSYTWVAPANASITGSTNLSAVSASASASGAYTFTVIVADASTMVSSLTVDLTANTPPGITAQPAAGSMVCAGSAVSVPVSATGSNLTYQWYKGSTPVANQTAATLSLPASTTDDAGSYLVVVANSGCQSVTSTAFSLTVNTAPTISISPLAITLIGGQSATLTASGASSYSWSTESSQTAIVVSPVAETVYSVTGSSANGCSARATATVSLSCGQQVMANVMSATVVGQLSPGNCSVTLRGVGYGAGFTFTGPGGYVFSAVYRRVGMYTINAPNVTQPGTYTMTVNYTDACGRSSSDTTTYVVTGEACK